MARVNPLETYRHLVDRYYEMIHGESWWDGRRESLVTEMDDVWRTMTLDERNQAMKYITVRYEERLANSSP